MIVVAYFFERALLPALAAALRPGGLHDLVRVAAAEGLGELIPHLERAEQAPAKDALEDALRDPHGRVRRAAAHALGAAGASERLDAVAAYARTLTHQDRVGIERLIARLGKRDPDAASKQLDGLRDKLRALVPPEFDASVGQTLYVTAEPARCHLFDPASGKRR